MAARVLAHDPYVSTEVASGLGVELVDLETLVREADYAARRHREVVVNGFRQLREELDSFNPDAVLIWGDDQYENFHEDVVPPFCDFHNPPDAAPR